MKKLEEIMKSGSYILPRLPDAPGVYVLSDDSERLLYIGSSKQLSRRISHLTALQNDKTNTAGFSHIKAGCVRKHQENSGNVHVRWATTRTSSEAKELEKELLADAQTAWNGFQCIARIKRCKGKTCSPRT